MAQHHEHKPAGAQDLLLLARQLKQSDEGSAVWLNTRMDIFGGKTPLEHAKTAQGRQEVEDLIGRLKHGVFS